MSSLPALLRPVASHEDAAERLGTLVRLTADVLLAHRSDIRDLAGLATGQLGELKAATYNADRLFRSVEALMECGVIDAEEAKEARRELRGICDLKGRMVALGMLTGLFGRLQELERSAFGIEDGERPEDDEQDVAGLLVEFVNAPQQAAAPATDGALGRTARRIV